MDVDGIDLIVLAGELAAYDAEALRRLADGLRAFGVRPRVVCVAGSALLHDGPEAIEVAGLGSRWRQGWAARRLVRDEAGARPDLIHVLGPEMAEAAIGLAERWEVPYVLTVGEFLPPGGRLRISRTFCRGLIATGPELAEDLVRNLYVPRRALTIVPPGVVLPAEDPAERPSAAEAGRVPVVGTAGRLESGSGLATFLAAARRVLARGVASEFIVAGRGPAEAELRRLADRLRLADRVTFADEPAEGGTLWRALDVFCQPALAPSTGRALTAALAHAVPAIVSDVDGLRALVAEGGAGILVPPGDPDALARAILGLLDDPNAARALGRLGRNQVARVSDPLREAEMLAGVYRKAVATTEGILTRVRTDRATRPP